MSRRLLEKIEEDLNIIAESPVSIHHRYSIIRSVIIPRCNYGGLIERCLDKDRDTIKEGYLKIDYLIKTTLTKLL